MKDEKTQPEVHTKRTYRLINLREAAQKLGIATPTLYMWCQMKRISYYKIGRYLKFDEHDLEEFISGQRVEQRL